MTLDILRWPHPILSKVAEPVTDFSKDLSDLAEEMFVTMNEANGIGLAAPQIGKSIRMFVIHIPFTEEDTDETNHVDTEVTSSQEEDKKDITLVEEWWHNQDFVFVNPQIISSSGKVVYNEGCLSLPEINEDITRYQKIKVKYFSLDGVEHTIEANDLFSVCIQHELDHLDGKVFIQRLSRLKFSLLKKRILKEIKEAEKKDNLL